MVSAPDDPFISSLWQCAVKGAENHRLVLDDQHADLFGPGGKWVGVPMREALRCPLARAESGLRVQVMYHPSSRRYWRDARPEAKRVLAEEVRRLAGG